MKLYVTLILATFAAMAQADDSAVPFAQTYASIQSRGVLGQEQIKEDLVGFNEDLSRGQIRSVSDIKQPALKDLIQEISEDDKQVKEIDGKFPEGSELEKISSTLNSILKDSEKKEKKSPVSRAFFYVLCNLAGKRTLIFCGGVFLGNCSVVS
jgi:hypothetical protein